MNNGTHKYNCSWEDTLKLVTPYLASLACVSFVVMLSNFFTGKKRMMVQTICMCVATSYCLWFLGNDESDDVLKFWNVYQSLSYEFRFILGIFTAGAAYFGGALYLSNVVIDNKSDVSAVLATPATNPVNTMIELPKSLPADNKEFFQSMLKRYGKVPQLNRFLLSCVVR